MAAYPSLRICIGSRVKPDAGIDIDRASNGAGRGRRLYTDDKREFLLEHKALDASDRATLDAFYAANKDLAVDLTFDGVTYSCLFASAPRPDYIGASLADVTVELVEV